MTPEDLAELIVTDIRDFPGFDTTWENLGFDDRDALRDAIAERIRNNPIR